MNSVHNGLFLSALIAVLIKSGKTKHISQIIYLCLVSFVEGGFGAAKQKYSIVNVL
jgi:hypothetical protein